MMLKFSVIMELHPDVLLKVRSFCHVLIAIHHVYASLWFVSLDVAAIKNQKFIDLMKFADRYLTGWNFALQVMYFGVALYCDYGELWPKSVNEKKFRRLKKFRDFCFTSLVFPVSMFVATMFWIVWIIDREMILPSECDQFIPMWLNHSTHTWIVPITLLEVALQPRRRPQNETPNLLTLGGYHLFYSSVLIGTYFHSGRWIYPIYNSMTWIQRSLFLTIILYMSFLFYYIGWHTNDLFWKNKYKTYTKLQNNTQQIGEEFQEKNHNF